MIRAELHTHTPGSVDYTPVAALTIHDDNTWTLDDPTGRFDTSIGAIVPTLDTPDGALRNLTFTDDPATWVRNAHTIYRGGVECVVITHDDGTPTMTAATQARMNPSADGADK